MAARQDEFLKLRNFQEVRSTLGLFADGRDLEWIDDTAKALCTRWFRLAQQHLRAARQLADSSRDWRCVVSRCYYAVYNGSKSVRYYVSGSVDLTADDHKRVGDLPGDFPNPKQWSEFAGELRRDRNLADYEPWEHVRRSLTHTPTTALARSGQFVQACRDYLRGRGVSL